MLFFLIYFDHILSCLLSPIYVLSGGRLVWAAVSDAIGRRKTFYMFTLGALPLFGAMPTLVNAVVTTGDTLPLYGFCATTVLALSIFGGTYAIMPAYEADLFGSKNVNSIHGRMLLFSATSALIGE